MKGKRMKERKKGWKHTESRRKKWFRLGHGYGKRPCSIGSKLGEYPLTCKLAVAMEMGE